MKRYYVYLLRCMDGSYYAGVTNNLERRLWEHNNDPSSQHYTYSRRPVELVWAADYKEIKDAIRFEKQLKGWSRAKKEALIAGDWSEIIRLSNQKNALSGVPSAGGPSAGSPSTSSPSTSSG